MFGLAVSVTAGVRAAKAERPAYWGVAFLIALFLGIGLTFAQVAFHTLCIEAKACTSRGDVNMSYWFHSFFSIPLFWLAAGSSWQMRR